MILCSSGTHSRTYSPLGRNIFLIFLLVRTMGKKTFQNLHYCHNQGLAWSCWTSCFLWDHFLYRRCTASCHSYYRHHEPPSRGKVQIMKLRHVRNMMDQLENSKNLQLLHKCHLSSFKIGKLLTSRYSNHSAPILQSRPKSFVRKLATFCRPLLDMKPVAANSLMLASTKGIPVIPSTKSNSIFSGTIHKF